jgi:endonuclease/exonuclease/phosphatase family metal-dependent hydrolase
MSELRILSYNVKLLPPHVKFGVAPRGLPIGFWERGKHALPDEVRAKAILRAILAGHWDVVCLQEVFQERLRGILRKGFVKAGYQVIDEAHDGDLLNEDSGLFVASKLPIVHRRFEEFAAKEGSDALADKGVLGLCLKTPKAWKAKPHQLFLFTTHLQASGDHTRRHQLRQLQRFVRGMLHPVKKKRAVSALLVGDMNVRAEEICSGCQGLTTTGEYRAMMSLLDHPRDLFREQNPKAHGATWDGAKNPRMIRGNDRRAMRIDYAFAYDFVPEDDPHAELLRLKKLHCKGAIVEPFQTGKLALSDHYAISTALHP